MDMRYFEFRLRKCRFTKLLRSPLQILITQETMVAWLLLLIVCTNCVFIVHGRQEVLFCDGSQQALFRPSLLEVTQAAVNSGGKQVEVGFERFLQAYEEYIPSVFHVGIPAAQWFADGVYSLNFTASPEVSKYIVEVNLLQEDESLSLSRLPFCLLGWSSWCSCAAESASDVMKVNFDNRAPCVTPLSRQVHQHFVDPSRPSCVQIIIPDHMDGRLLRSPSVVSYSVQVPTMDTELLRLVVNRLLSSFPTVAQTVLQVANHFPAYLVSFAIGLYLIFNAQDIAEERAFQLLLQVVLGLGAAVVVLCFLAHRTVHTLLSRFSPRFIDSLFSLSLSSILYFHRHYLAREAFTQILAFWDEGAFGIWWIGRVYFGLCLSVSLGVCHYFDLFRDPDSSSFAVTQGACRLLGIMCLLHGSSSSTVSLLCTLAALLLLPLQSYLHFWVMVCKGLQQRKQQQRTHATLGSASSVSPAMYPRSPSPQKKSGHAYYTRSVERQVQSSGGSVRYSSREEVEAMVSRTTAAHLLALRQHLQANPAEQVRAEQLMVQQGRDDSARLLQQFTANLYSGRPTLPKGDADDHRGFFSWRTVSRVLQWGVVVAVAVGVFALRSDTISVWLSQPHTTD